jgi:hypothetical protein
MPYAGQGKSLPDYVGHAGEWIEEGRFFLVQGPDTPLTSDRPRTIYAARTPDGKRCWGFEIEHLALSLDLTASELLAINRRGDLTTRLVAATGPSEIGKNFGHVFLRTPRKILDIELERINVIGNVG